MPVDVAAEVIANHPLSADYNVLALRAPEIARTAAPGQFVMVKAGRRHDPLLRRPFSVFEILRDDAGRAVRPVAAEQAHRAVDRTRVRSGAGTARRLPRAARPAVFAGRCTGRGVDGRRRRRAGAVRHARRVASRARRPLNALLRRAAGRGTVLSGPVSRPRGRSDADHRRRQRRRARPRHRAARAASGRSRPRTRRS